MCKEIILKTLSFCNLLDNSGALSLTNLGFVSILLKVVMSPSIDYPAMVSLVGLLVNYMHKRQVNSKGVLNENSSG